MSTDPEITTAVEELRSFVERCAQRRVEPGTRTARYVEIAQRTLDAYDSSIRSPSRDERLRGLARETRMLLERLERQL
jgi:hypothetical protein